MCFGESKLKGGEIPAAFISVQRGLGVALPWIGMMVQKQEATSHYGPSHPASVLRYQRLVLLHSIGYYI